MAPPFFIFLTARIPNYDVQAATHDVRPAFLWFGRRIFYRRRLRFVERNIWRFFRISIRLARDIAIRRPMRCLNEGH